MEQETKVCKHCKTEIPKKARICPNCRKKQSGILKWVLIVFAVLIVFGLANGGDDEEKKPSTDTAKTESESNKESVQVEYIQCTVDDLVKTLEENALKAEQTYQDQYVEVQGRLSNIDSDGDYISLSCLHDEWNFNTIQCYIENDEQLNKVMEMKTGDTVTVKGQITSIGEVLGYSLDIDEIK